MCSDGGRGADPDEFFETAVIRTVLEEHVLHDGTGTELAGFRFGPVYFDEPIVYAEPVPRGPGLNAIAALLAGDRWVSPVRLVSTRWSTRCRAALRRQAVHITSPCRSTSHGRGGIRGSE